MKKASFFIAFTLLFLYATNLQAGDDEIPMDRKDIVATLSDKNFESLDGSWKQVFFADGRTIYRAGIRFQATDGTWEAVVKNGQDLYCSIWTPNPKIHCYKMTKKQDQVTWVGIGEEAGEIYKARLVKKLN